MNKTVYLEELKSDELKLYILNFEGSQEVNIFANSHQSEVLLGCHVTETEKFEDEFSGCTILSSLLSLSLFYMDPFSFTWSL